MHGGAGAGQRDHQEGQREQVHLLLVYQLHDDVDYEVQHRVDHEHAQQVYGEVLQLVFEAEDYQRDVDRVED